MRVMVLVKATADSEAGALPSTELLEAMGSYNEELVKAGIMVDGAGLMSSAKGARVTLADGEAVVTDGPFTEIKEVIAGFWIWNCASLQEAIDWVQKCPIAHGQNHFEIRQMHELEDFATDGEGYEQHKKVEAQLAAQKSSD